MKKIVLILVLLLFLVGGCSHEKEDILNPDKPITITVWHYYHGQIKEKFDNLVSEFNETIGMERGIVVDAQSHSDVTKLSNAVYDAANKNIGAQPLPDIFAAYPENAFRVNKITPLVDLENYFSSQELSTYRQEFIEEGRFRENDKLKILPIAKSLEVLYLNKTYWDKFAAKNDVTLEDLRTWEGIVKTAEKYYNQTGNSFFGIDSNANFMILSAIQLGEEIYDYNGDNIKINFDKDLAKKIWEVYYIPYIKGHFNKMGRFSSDDARTGVVLAYTGSTAGAMYFPEEVSFSRNKSYPVEAEILPYPYYKDGEPYVFQQGAGMVITQSDKIREYAAALFLKWFTKLNQNIDFALSTGYFPVKDKALKEEVLLAELNEKDSTSTVRKTIKTSMQMFDEYNLYTNKPFKDSYKLRYLFENHLFNNIQKDKEILVNRVANGEDRSTVISELISQKEFEKWYQQFKQEAARILSE